MNQNPTSDFTGLIDLAAERVGGAVLFANDEFFAEKENLLKAKAAVFLEHEYTDRGKWMDGWETRRKRVPGYDYCVIRLGLPGVVRGVVVDTAFFRGNYPEHCSIEACVARPDATVEALLGPETRWVEILPKSKLEGNAKNLFSIDSAQRWTHLRLNIFPDGGVARLRVHGDVVPDWSRFGRAGAEVDVAAAENGAKVLSCSDMFFGVRHNLIAPGRAANMGEGWETKRRRGIFPEGAEAGGFIAYLQNDWALVELCAESVLRRIEVDTNHFKGNFPESCRIVGARLTSGEDPASASIEWRPVVARAKLQAHTRHYYEDEIVDHGPFTHLRLEIFPDGGVSRLRVSGTITRDGLAKKRLARLDGLTAGEAEAELLAVCGSRAWARAMVERRPFSGPEALFAAADEAWAGLSQEAWMEAFRAHPRIGERKAAPTQGATAAAWSRDEQSGTNAAAAETMAALAEGNRAYEARFGHVFLVCATGKTADEMLALLRSRIGNTPEAEVRIAAEEQRKITRIRLEKLLAS